MGPTSHLPVAWLGSGSLGIVRYLLSKISQAIIIPIMTVAAVPFLTGCGKSSNPYAALAKLYRPSPDTDLSSSPDYHFASFAGTVWKTKVRTAVANGKRYTGLDEVYLLVPRRFDPTEPDYLGSDVTDIIAVLPVGSQVRIERLMKDNGAWGGRMVTATVLSGTNSWKNVILDGWLLANNPAYSTNWNVSPDMLAPPASSAPEIGDTPQAGYKKGYANGKASAILAKHAVPGNTLNDPWFVSGSRSMAVKIYGEDYVARYESGYRKGFQDNSEEK